MKPSIIKMVINEQKVQQNYNKYFHKKTKYCTGD